MKKNKKYLTDKTVDNLSEKMAANQLPKFIILDIYKNSIKIKLVFCFIKIIKKNYFF